MAEALDCSILPASKKSRILIWRDEVQLATSPGPALSDIITSPSSSASSPSSDAGGGHLPTPTTTRSSAARNHNNGSSRASKRHSIAFGILPLAAPVPALHEKDEGQEEEDRAERRALRFWRRISRRFSPRGRHHREADYDDYDGMPRSPERMISMGGARAVTRGEVVRTDMYRGLQAGGHDSDELDEIEPAGVLAAGSDRGCAMAERQERLMRAAKLLDRAAP